MTQNLSNSGARLISFVERIERLAEEKQALTDDTKEVYAEVKSAGFDTKTLRRVIALRRVNAEDRKEIQALIDIYMAALDKMEAQATRENAEAGA